MRISYNWLKTLINIDISAEETADLLTASGLEVESLEYFESVKGGLKGVVVGEVIEKEKHPDADRLSLTKVRINDSTTLSIVCGAPNVAKGQKVLVATVGSTLYPTEGGPIEIKKSKIRGALSEGMICAEDEIGIGTNHDGILVLPPDTPIGIEACDYFKIEKDVVFEIGLTPNRSDAASHLGVARDLLAVLKTKHPELEIAIQIPGNYELPSATNLNSIEVTIENKEACPRYSGIVISGITVKASPDWLQNKLKSIGIRPINNVVDITNFVLHDMGQPLHAFDLEKIKGKQIIVKTCKKDTVFKTLDDVERKLQENDLMICDAESPMCIAGIFGGIESGVKENTTAVFLESAYFNSSYIRKTAKHHSLKTDASFRFERGTDPDITVKALRRASELILELCGGAISMDIVDIYPEKLDPYKVTFSYNNCINLTGKNIDKVIIKNIITNLGIEITSEGSDGLLLNVPRFKTDVTREADVIEEVMRIYGYNNIESSSQFNFSIQTTNSSDLYSLENIIANLLTGYGFNEIMSLSLSKEALYENKDKLVSVINPLSQDLNVLRADMLYSGLDAIAYNSKHKNSDLKLFEFGKTYSKSESNEVKYNEKKHLSVFICGKKIKENPYSKSGDMDFSYLKSCVDMILKKCGVTNFSVSDKNDDTFNYGLCYEIKKNKLAEFGSVNKKQLKKFDVNQSVFYANFDLELLFAFYKKNEITFSEIPKFPIVRRDLAMLLDKHVKYKQIEELAFTIEKKYLKEVNLFDVYEGEKISEHKKSYAVSFSLLNEEGTLTDKQIDGVMEKLIKAYKEKLNAELR